MSDRFVKWRRTILLATVSSLIALLVPACQLPHDPALTIAVTAASTEPNAWSQSLRTAAFDHANDSSAPGGGAVTVIVADNAKATTVDLTPMRGDEVEQDDANREKKIGEALPQLQRLITSAKPGADGLDVLGVLDRGLRATPEGGTLVLATSGVSTKDPLDFRKLGGWKFDVAKVVNGLAHDGVVPNASGRHLVFIGLGITYGAQPALPLPARDQVIKLYRAVCEAAKAASCTMLEGDPSLAAGPSTKPVPIVPVEATPTRCAGTINLPADVMFEKNSWHLTDAADAALRPVARLLKQCPSGLVANFVGHTAKLSAGDPAGGFELSERRAQACWNRLAELGVPRQVLGSVRGLGDTQPRVDNLPNGIFTESLARLNRRTEIRITNR